MLVVTKRFPDLDNALHQAIVGDGDISPYRLHEFVLGDDLSVPSGQHLQYFPRLRTQGSDRMPGVICHRAAPKIDHTAIQAKQHHPLRCG